MAREKRLYGTWRSPLSVPVVMNTLRLNNVTWDHDSETLLWSEGNGTLVAQSELDAPLDLTGDRLQARGQLNYGGGEMVAAGGYVYFTAKRLYRVPITGGRAAALTPAYAHVAAPAVSPDGAWVVYLFSYEGMDGIAVVDTKGRHWPRKLFTDSDFVMQPLWHPSGDYLAFVTWNQPYMPWDATELRLAKIAHDTSEMPYLESVETLAGGSDTAVFQPEFSPDGRYLSYVSDESGFGQIYLRDLETGIVQQITSMTAEHGRPAWLQGVRTYVWARDGQRLYFLRNTRGFITLHYYTLATRSESAISGLEQYTYLEQITQSPAGQLGFIASAAQIPPQIISLNPQTGQLRVHRRSTPATIQSHDLAPAEAVEWTGHDGETVYGLYFPPASRRYVGEGAPPLIVDIHGGPTSQTYAAYDARMQFFTTRGFGVLSVNHRGSTGHGREYMLRHRGNWGVYDVEDAASGAAYLAQMGKADRDKLIIMGGSAGGFTVLMSLIAKPGFYAAGICRYGVANAFILSQDTHKFEARYFEMLLGSLPEAQDVYRERSALFHADRIRDPIILFHGADDPVVAVAQSDAIVAVLKARGVPHEYHVYQGEGHGFKKPETLEHHYTTILKFLERHVNYV
jgi:dipeptidyl aminopeptidase/acylaminoacyl peptidase